MEHTLIEIVTDSINSAITVVFVLEQALSGKPITELVRVGPFIEDHLTDGTHQELIVTTTTDHIRPLSELLELLFCGFLQFLFRLSLSFVNFSEIICF